jgi:hypothetical protein
MGQVLKLLLINAHGEQHGKLLTQCVGPEKIRHQIGTVARGDADVLVDDHLVLGL